MQVEEMSLKGVFKLTPKVYFDERGFFYESFKEPLLEAHGLCHRFFQDNHSFSKRGVLRGMHFQKGQAKLINVICGKILDVFVDIRKDSPTFGNWQGVILDGQDKEMLLIPDGFAHGFYVLSEEAHLLYKVSELYDKDLEKSFRYDDPSVNIGWPEGDKIISQRDLQAQLFSEVIK